MAEYRLITFCLTNVFLGIYMALFFKEKIQLENNHSCVEFYGAGALVF